MFNLHGEYKDNYIPLFCSWTKKIIKPSDKRYVVINIRMLKNNFVFSKKFISIAFSSRLRSQGLSDLALEIIMSKL